MLISERVRDFKKKIAEIIFIIIKNNPSQRYSLIKIFVVAIKHQKLNIIIWEKLNINNKICGDVFFKQSFLVKSKNDQNNAETAHINKLISFFIYHII